MIDVKQAKHFIGMIAREHGTDPDIGSRHEPFIEWCLAHPQEIRAEGSDRPMFRPWSPHDLYLAMLQIEEEGAP